MLPTVAEVLILFIKGNACKEGWLYISFMLFFTAEFIFRVGTKCAFEVILLPCEIRDCHKGDAEDQGLFV